MAITDIERQLWKDRDRIARDKARLLELTKPLEEKKIRHQASIEAARNKVAEIEDQITAIVGEPVTGLMAQLCAEEAIVARALHGKSRPED